MPRGDVVIFAEKHAGKQLKDLPEGSIIGTSSLRRITNLKHRYSHLKYENIRGNLNTRLTKLQNGIILLILSLFLLLLIISNTYFCCHKYVGLFDAIILAEAGVFRLGWSDKIG